MCEACENYKTLRRQLAPDLPVSARSKKLLAKPFVIWYKSKRQEFYRKTTPVWHVWKRYTRRVGRDQAFELMKKSSYWGKYYDMYCEDLK